MKYVVWGLVVLLAILHQDFWNWKNTNLLFGFLPVALMYHACISVGACITWYLATLYAWPLDDDLDTPEAGGAAE